MEWCKSPDAGLPAPDLLVHFELAAAEAESRPDFGGERYEVASFQALVKTQVRAFCFARVLPKVFVASTRARATLACARATFTCA